MGPHLNLHRCRILGLSAIALAFYQCGNQDQAEHDRPNVLFIMSDDHTYQAISAYGHKLAEVCPTPNIDRIANQGMIFNNCFVTNSICSPSRAAILTGKYAHKNGVYKFTALDHSQPTLPKMMQEAGYNTSITGKYHLHSNPVGFDYFSVLPGQGRYHDPVLINQDGLHPSGWIHKAKRTEYKGHSSDVITDRALDYLQNKRDKDKPFMLFCQYKAPHDTWEYAERYEDFLADVEIPEPENLFDDYEGREALKSTLQYIGSEWGNHTNFEEETAHLEGEAKRKMQYQLYMKKYLRCVKGVDDNVGRVLDYLEENGLAENTIIIYTGDQGFFLGEHGLYDKRWMYEEAFRMPYLMSWPGRIEPGSSSDAMITNVDFAPTILDAVGLEPHEEMQGRSFLSVLDGSIPDDWRTSMYYRYYYSHFETEPHWGIRTYTHKLIYFDRMDSWELYDLEKDPSEMNNIYNDPENKDLIAGLKAELTRLQTELEDDPNDIGDNPNIGHLAPKALHVTDAVDVGKGDVSLLFRFKTNGGGNLFSKCKLGEGDEEMNWRRFKSMSVIDKGLCFYFVPANGEDYDDDGLKIEYDFYDNEWHTVALILNGKIPSIYIDGKLKHTFDQKIMDDDPGHSFNIAAGTEWWMDYNYVGEISDVLYYDEILTEQDIQSFNENVTTTAVAEFEWLGTK